MRGLNGLVPAALLVLAGCTVEEDEVCYSEKYPVATEKLLDTLDLPGIERTSTLFEVAATGPRIDRVCGPNAVRPGEAFTWTLSASLDTPPGPATLGLELTLGLSGATVPTTVGEDGAVTLTGRLNGTVAPIGHSFRGRFGLLDLNGRLPSPATVALAVVDEVPPLLPPVCTYTLRTPEALLTSTAAVTAVALPANGALDWLAAGGQTGDIALWRRDDGRRRHTLHLADGPVRSLLLGRRDADHLDLAAGSDTGDLVIFSVETGAELLRRPLHEGPVAGLAIAPGTGLLASGGWDGTVHVIEVDTGSERFVHQVGERVNAVAISPDGMLVAAAAGRLSFPGRLEVWRADDGASVLSATLAGPATAVSFAADGASLFVGHGRGAIDQWRVGDDAPVQTLLGPDDLVSVLAQPATQPGALFAAHYDGRTAVWNVATGAQVDEIQVPVGAATAALAPDGSLIALGFSDGAARVLDLAQTQAR
ncbi:MAG: hypothetical protein KC620_09360 [Myxococcales bacterium]|nr:hypothetical protein [Myxococcales bacterium]